MEITVQQLKEKFNSGDKFLLLDVREPWEFEEFNLGGQLMPVGDIMNKMWELEDHKESEIVVHCRSGARSGMAQGLLMANGFKNVRNLKGGVMEWEAVFGKGAKP
jgi:rhodanese-related sulfurtransferase